MEFRLLLYSQFELAWEEICYCMERLGKLHAHESTQGATM